MKKTCDTKNVYKYIKNTYERIKKNIHIQIYVYFSRRSLFQILYYAFKPYFLCTWCIQEEKKLY